MKPRLKKIGNLWYCSSGAARLIGLGYTPAQAYKEWAESR